MGHGHDVSAYLAPCMHMCKGVWTTIVQLTIIVYVLEFLFPEFKYV